MLQRGITTLRYNIQRHFFGKTEYLFEFEARFEASLDVVSGTHMELLMKKTGGIKSRDTAPLIVSGANSISLKWNIFEIA